MKQAAKPLLWAGALVGVGILLLVLLKWRGAEAPAPAAAPETTLAAQPAAQATVPAAQDADNQPPPWMQGAMQPQGTAAAAASAVPAFGNRAPSRAELNQALERIREKSLQNERAADAMLQQLDTLQASGKLPPGINADALRDNLKIARRTQVLSRELGELINAPAGTETKTRMDAIVAELQQLQKQLRYDVGGPAAPVAVAGNGTP